MQEMLLIYVVEKNANITLYVTLSLRVLKSKSKDKIIKWEVGSTKINNF